MKSLRETWMSNEWSDLACVENRRKFLLRKPWWRLLMERWKRAIRNPWFWFAWLVVGIMLLTGWLP